MLKPISDSTSPGLEQAALPTLPGFVKGSSSGATHNNPDLDHLTNRLQAAASFDDKDNVWTQIRED